MITTVEEAVKVIESAGYQIDARKDIPWIARYFAIFDLGISDEFKRQTNADVIMDDDELIEFAKMVQLKAFW